MSDLDKNKHFGPLGPLILLAILSFSLTALAYGLSLGVTFIAEDWIHVVVAQHILFGDTSLLVDSFTQPWLQTSRVGVFYRPVVDLTFLFDTYLRQLFLTIFGPLPGPGGGEVVPVYRLTNLFLHALTSFFVGLNTYILTKRINGKNANLASIVATALSAANPLSLETLLWIVCRGDGLSACLSMATLAFYLLSLTVMQKRRQFALASYATFILALISKENAIILPLTIFLIWALFYKEDRKGLQNALLYLTILAIFLPLRALAIGGLGGYQGSMGEIIDKGMLSRFLSSQVWLRVAYPYNQKEYSAALYNILQFLYSCFYLALGASLIFSLVRKYFFDTRMFLFAGVSFLLTLLPAMQAFLVMPDLSGARTLYLPECFLSIFLGYFITQTTKPLFATVWTGLFVCLLISTSNLNIVVFLNYSATMQKVTEKINEFASHNPANLISLANLPFNYNVGSFVGEIWQVRVACAGTRGDISSKRLVTSAVAYHSYQDLFNTSRALSQAKTMGAALLCVLPGAKEELRFVSPEIIKLWQAPLELTFKGIRFAPMPTRILSLRLNEPSETTGFQSADFAEVLVKRKGLGNEKLDAKLVESIPKFYPIDRPDGIVTLHWHTDYAEFVYPNNSMAAPFVKNDLVLYRFPLSDKFSYKCATMLHALTFIGLPPDYEIVSLTLRDGKNLMPTLEPRSLQKEDDLIYGAISTRGEPIEFTYDLSAIKDADRVFIELTKPDAPFIHTVGTLMESAPRKTSVLGWQQDGIRGTVRIDISKIPAKGRYQVRVMSIDVEGKTKGYFSFPQDIVYNPEGFGAIDQPQATDFQRMLFDSRPSKK